MRYEEITVYENIDLYKNFGWFVHDEVFSSRRVRSGRHHRTVETHGYVLRRDMDMPHYKVLSAYQTKYFALKNSKKYYQPMDGLTVLLLFLMLIIPGIIYVSVKSSQKEKIEFHNEEVENEMRKILENARSLL